MAGNQPRGNGSKVLVILISIVWLLFLAGIIGYNPYMKNHVPTQIENKPINEQNQNDVGP